MEQIWDMPPVTMTFLVGCIVESVLLRLNVLHETDMFFTWEHVFRKGQYRRLFYPIFYVGKGTLPNTITAIYLSVKRLQKMENSIPDRKRFLLKLFCLYSGILMLGKYIDFIPVNMLLTTNICYYNAKKKYSMPIVLAPRLEVDEVWIMLTMVACYILSTDYRSLFEFLPYFLPAHVLHYVDEIICKTYGIGI